MNDDYILSQLACSTEKKRISCIFIKLFLKTKKSHTYHLSALPLLFVKHIKSSGVQYSHFLLRLPETQVLG